MKLTGDRTLHLIDIENLIGTGSPTAAQAREAGRLYKTQHVAPSDQVVVACSHHAYERIAWELKGDRHLLRSGADGADLELLDVIRRERVDERFASVVIGSGDGIFADAAAQLAAAGVHVKVVSRPENLSRRLRLAAHVYVPLPILSPAARPMEAA